MKTRVLPVIWTLSAAVTAVGVLIFARHIEMNPLLALGLAWLCSIVAALLIGGLAVWLKPDLRFSTRTQVDGLGFVHQPFGMIVYITVIALLGLVLSFFKR